MSRFLTAIGLAALSALSALTACGGGNDGPRASGVQLPAPMLPAVTPLPECRDADYSTCDIRNDDCQARLIALATCLRRSDPVDGVSIELMSEDDYTALAMQDYADYPEQPTHYDRALSVLDLALAEGVSKVQAVASRVDFVYGVYRAEEKRIVIVDHGKPDDSANENAVLVHEYVHALQDADFDLTTWPQGVDASTFDGFLATDAVVEGEAAFYQYRIAAPLLGINADPRDFFQAMDSFLQDQIGKAAGSPTPLGASYSTFPYGFGAPLAFDAWTAGGPRRIDELWASPPQTTQQIFVRLYRRGTEQSSSTPIAEPSVTTLTLDSQDSLGAWGLELFYIRHDVTTELVDHTVAWRGDQLWIYTDETAAESYGLWQVELETAAESQALDDVFAGISGVEHGTDGTRVFASFGFEKAAPELTAWGQSWLVDGN